MQLTRTDLVIYIEDRYDPDINEATVEAWRVYDTDLYLHHAHMDHGWRVTHGATGTMVCRAGSMNEAARQAGELLRSPQWAAARGLLAGMAFGEKADQSIPELAELAEFVEVL